MAIVALLTLPFGIAAAVNPPIPKERWLVNPATRKIPKRRYHWTWFILWTILAFLVGYF